MIHKLKTILNGYLSKITTKTNKKIKMTKYCIHYGDLLRVFNTQYAHFSDLTEKQNKLTRLT